LISFFYLIEFRRCSSGGAMTLRADKNWEFNFKNRSSSGAAV
jgi:hypothetical protein